MFADLLTFREISGLLDRRFVTVWLPSLLFWGLVLMLVVLDVGLQNALQQWTGLPGEIKVILTVLAIAWITFFAYLILSILRGLIRLYEGYWGDFPLLRRLGESRKRYYRRQLDELSARKDYQYSIEYYYFPPKDLMAEHAMPTLLGNILKSSELYPLVRYNIDAVVVWPRLYSVFPSDFARRLADAGSSVDLMIIISFLGVLFSIAGSLLSAFLLGWWAVLGCLLGGVVVAYLGSRGAVLNAVPYTELIKSGFDLYRNDLLKTIGWDTPNSWLEDRQRWEQISKLWYRGAPDLPDGLKLLGYPAKPIPSAADEPNED